MEDASLFYHFSDERLARYWEACQKDMPLTLQLYRANSRLANEFRTLIICNMEVFVRNTLNQQIANHLNDPNWLLTQYEQLPRMPHKYLIKEIKTRYHNRGWALDHNELIAKLNLKFWESLLHEKPFATLKGSPICAFSNRSAGFSRGQIVNKLASIRHFRNRITHGEPIIFAQNLPQISLYQAKIIYRKIYALLDWLCPTMVPFVKEAEAVEEVMNQIELAFKKIL